MVPSILGCGGLKYRFVQLAVKAFAALSGAFVTLHHCFSLSPGMRAWTRTRQRLWTRFGTFSSLDSSCHFCCEISFVCWELCMIEWASWHFWVYPFGNPVFPFAPICISKIAPTLNGLYFFKPHLVPEVLLRWPWRYVLCVEQLRVKGCLNNLLRALLFLGIIFSIASAGIIFSKYIWSVRAF